MENEKSKSFFGGVLDSGHPNFINPFEYDKYLPDKSVPKRIGALAGTQPKIFRGADMPPPVFRYAQIGRGK